VALRAPESKSTDTDRAKEEPWGGDELYRTLVENIGLGINVVDADYRIVMVNPAVARMFRKPPEEFVGRACFEEFEKRDAVCPHCPGTKAMATGQPETAETHGTRDDGSRFAVRTHAFPLAGMGGAARGFIEVVEDITERKRAEDRARHLAMIAEQTGEGIAEADLEGNLQFVNAAWVRMHGYQAADQLVGKHLSVCHTDEQMKTDVVPFNQEVVRRGWHRREIGHVRKDGTPFSSEMTVTVFKDEGGKPIGLIGFMTDITERKRAEEELKKTLAELERFNRLAVGRELRMIELKREVNEMARRAGLMPPYELAFAEHNPEGHRGQG
jgi:PAS domain S-box-containing protein